MPKVAILFLMLASSAFAQDCLSNIKKTTDFLQIHVERDQLRDLYKEAQVELAINNGLKYLSSKKLDPSDDYEPCCQTGEKSTNVLSVQGELAQKTRIMLWKMYDQLDADGQDTLEAKVRWLEKDLTLACIK